MTKKGLPVHCSLLFYCHAGNLQMIHCIVLLWIQGHWSGDMNDKNTERQQKDENAHLCDAPG